MQPDLPVAVDGVRDPGTPAEQAAWQRLDVVEQPRDVQPGEALELLPDDAEFEIALALGGHVLPVAPAAAPRPGVRARSLDALRGRAQYLDRVGAAVRAAGVLGDAGPDQLAGQGVTHEDDPSGVPRDAEPAMAGGADLELEDLTELTRRRAFRHLSASPSN